ncbi:MAG TPA: hypothetical protein VFM29_08470, partial [Vicinamibacteria bacterium]|nr:hypothetical protein [Vicinamibacteria bacterium]
MRVHGARPGLVRAILVTVAVKAAAVVLMLTVFQPTYWFNHLILDVFTWREFFADVQGGLFPYVHIAREYPVGAGMIYWAMSPLMDPGFGMGMLIVHAAVMLAFDVVVTAFAWRCFDRISPAHATLGAIALGVNLTSLTESPFRFESVLLVSVLAGWDAHLQGRHSRAALWWSIGCWVKWYPALLLLLQEVQGLALGRRRQWQTSGAIFAAVAVLANAPFLVAAWMARGTIEPWLYPYRFHLERPVYWDTPYGLWQLWHGPAPLERLGSGVSLALVLAAVLWRPRMRLEAKAVVACAAGMVVNRLYSPQFHLWFYPFLIGLILLQRDRAAARRLILAGVALDVVNVFAYPFSLAYAVTEMQGFAMGAAARGGAWTIAFTVAVVVRLLALGVVAVLAWKSGSAAVPATAVARHEDPSRVPGRLAAWIGGKLLALAQARRPVPRITPSMVACAALLAALAGARLATAPDGFSHPDGYSFALAVERYSLAESRPFWPGYPVLILLARVVERWTGDALIALHALSALAGAFSAVPIAVIACRLAIRVGASPMAAGGLAAALWTMSPVAWAIGSQPYSDPTALFFVLSATAVALSTRTPGGAFTTGLLAGMAIGCRPTYAELLPMIAAAHPAWALEADERRRSLRASLLGFASVCMAWLAWQVTNDGFLA